MNIKNAVVAGLAAFAVGTVLAEPTYQITDLGVANGIATSINNSGQIVVGNNIWSNGSLTPLPKLPGFPVPIGWQGNAINDSGQVVGFSKLQYSNGQADTPTIWNGGTPSALERIGGSFANATDINTGGAIVGYSTLPGNSVSHATLWNNGVVTDLGNPFGATRNSSASAINDQGHVVGMSNMGLAGYAHATLWHDGTTTDLGTLGGTASGAVGINNAGQVVGWSDVSGNSVRHSVLWSGGSFIDMGSLGGNSTARGINSAGLAVGYSLLQGSSSVLHGTFWDGSTLIDLNDLLDPTQIGWTIRLAYDINDAGQIVGQAINSSGQHRAVLLSIKQPPVVTDPPPVVDPPPIVVIDPPPIIDLPPIAPVPEPETYAMILAGLGLLGLVARRRKQKSA